MKSSYLMTLTLGLCLCGYLAKAGDGDHAVKGKHLKEGLSCITCHQKENPTATLGNSDACMNCHGDYPAMAETTKHLAKNPHKPEKLTTACFSCHKQH